jgi:hypothetical protein
VYLDGIAPCGEALLWSMKEAAYKLNYRLDPKRRFAPKSLVARINNSYGNLVFGEVIYADQVVLTKSLYSGQYLHSIALAVRNYSEFDQCGVSLQKLQKQYPRILKNAAGVPLARIVKDEYGIPRFQKEKAWSERVVSISHDGEKLAISWYPR